MAFSREGYPRALQRRGAGPPQYFFGRNGAVRLCFVRNAGAPAHAPLSALVAKSLRGAENSRARTCLESHCRPKAPTRHSGATAASGGGGGATSPTTCSSSARARPALTRRSLRASLTFFTRTHPECRCHRRSRPSASPVARCHPPPKVRPSSRATSSPPRLAAWRT